MRWSGEDEYTHSVESLQEGGFKMHERFELKHTNQLYQTDRLSLGEILRKFRSHDDETDGGDYSNRDELERKLFQDGELDALDVHMLQVAVCDQVQNADLRSYYMSVLK